MSLYTALGTEHEFVTECSNRCGRCWICELGYCRFCGQFDGGLTTHCPGSGNKPPDELDTYAGQVDFRAGKWRIGMRNRVMYRSIEQGIAVEERYISELRKENARLDYRKEAKEHLQMLKDIRRSSMKDSGY